VKGVLKVVLKKLNLDIIKRQRYILVGQEERKKKRHNSRLKKQTKFTLVSDTPELHIPQLNI